MLKIKEVLKGDSVKVAAVFAIFFLFLIVQYGNVTLYFDDWGYLTLDYQYTVPNVRGHEYTFSQIGEFLNGYYQNWSGSVLFLGAFLGIFKLGLPAVRLFFAAAIFIIFGTIFTISRNELPQKNKGRAALLSCVLLGAFPLVAVRDGFYWFSAATVLVLPICVLCVILAIEFYATGKWRWILPILYFVAAFSSDQISVTVMVLSILLVFLRCKRRESGKGLAIINCLTAVTGGVGFFLAPGNHVRMLELCGNMPLVERIFRGTEDLVLGFYNPDFLWYMIIFFVVIIAACSELKTRDDVRIYKISGMYQALSVLLLVLTVLSGGDFFAQVRRIGEPAPFLMTAFLIVYTAGYLWLLLLTLGKHWHIQCTSLIAFVSTIPAIWAGSFEKRMLLPFLLLLLPGMICVIEEYMDRDGAGKYITDLIVCVCLINLIYIFQGYYVNKPIYLLNDRIMTEAAKNEEKTVVLVKNKKDAFNALMPYSAGAMEAVTEEKMRNYYGINNETEIEWTEANQLSAAQKDIEITMMSTAPEENENIVTARIAVRNSLTVPINTKYMKDINLSYRIFVNGEDITNGEGIRTVIGKLKPGETKEVDMKIELPENMPEGAEVVISVVQEGVAWLNTIDAQKRIVLPIERERG